MKTSTIPQAHVEVAEKPVRRLTVVQTGEAHAVAQPRRGDNWVLGIALALLCAFTVSFAVYILQPAMATATGSNASAWTDTAP